MSTPNSISFFESFPPFVETSSTQYSSTWPPQTKLKASATHNAAMREIIKPWAGLSSMPPGCRAVCYSSWSRFSSSDTSSKSKEDLLASVLWTPKGTSPDYNPPPTEWAYLGVEQPIFCGNPEADQQRSRHRRQPRSEYSWSSGSDSAGAEMKSEAMRFSKVAVKGVSTSSLLTESLKGVPAAGVRWQGGAIGVLARGDEKNVLSASMLPSAFDSDSEDEEDE